MQLLHEVLHPEVGELRPVILIVDVEQSIASEL
jgi:hypothetical protein